VGVRVTDLDRVCVGEYVRDSVGDVLGVGVAERVAVAVTVMLPVGVTVTVGVALYVDDTEGLGNETVTT
jgi:invasion protein IalB